MDRNNTCAVAPAELTLDDIRKINGLPKVPLADLERVTARADVIAAEAEADRAKLDAARPALLLSGTDAQLGEHDAAAAAFSRKAERAAALAAALRGRVEVARGDLAEVARIERYDAAAALLKAVPADVEADYHQLVKLGRSIVERIARAGVATRSVNSDLPAGRPALRHPETFRWVDDDQAKVVRARRMWLYVNEGGQPIEDQSKVQPRWSVDAEGRPLADMSKPQRHPADLGFAGRYKTDQFGQEVRRPEAEIHVRRWQFVDCETVDAVRRSHVDGFVGALKIPALRDLEPVGWDMDGRADPHQVLDALSDRKSPSAVHTTPTNPPVSRTMTLDSFERMWGPLDGLGIAVEDGSAEASRRRSSSPRDDFAGAVGIGYRRGSHGSADAPSVTRL